MATKPNEFVKKEEFDNAVSTILDKLESLNQTKAVAPETPAEVEVKKAGPDTKQVNPEWDAEARTILGDLLDHTEVQYNKNGGVNFTIVIKKEKSNAGEEYLTRMGADRRTKEVGASGMEGVTEWCKLVRGNIRRTERV
jgi:hypothetical protein